MTDEKRDEVNQLIQALDKMYKEVKPVEGCFVTSYHEEELKAKSTPAEIAIVDEANNLTEVLITNGGQLDYEARQMLSDKGYSITVVERDSFGPLVCGIFKERRADGMLTFG